MKRQYLIPNTTTVSIQFCSICTTSTTGRSIIGNSSLSSGGENNAIDPM